MFNRIVQYFTALRPGNLAPSPTWVDSFSDAVIPIVDFDPRTSDLDAQRYSSPREQLDTLSWEEQSVSHATWLKVRAGAQKWYIRLTDKNGIELRNSAKVKSKLMSIIQRNTYSPNDVGFIFSLSIDSVLEQMLRQVAVTGAIAAEVPVDKKRQPLGVRVDSASSIYFKERAPLEYVPFIRDAQGSEVSLDRPNFFWSRLDAKTNSPNCVSPIQPVLSTVYFYRKFINTLQEVVDKVAWPRVSVKMIDKQILASIPADQVGQEEAYLKKMRLELSRVIQSLKPGQVLVHGDYLEIGLIESKSQIRGTLDPSPLLISLERHLASANKTYPSVLGVDAAVDPLHLYLEGQSIRGYQNCVQDIMSQILTFMLRLLGVNGYATFHYANFELRPDSELEASRSQKFATNKQLLFMGLMTAEDFSLAMTGMPLPADSLAHELFNRHDLLTESKQIPNSETDTSKSPASPIDPSDDRSKPDTTAKRGKTPSVSKRGDIKTTRRGTSRKPRKGGA